MDKTELLRALNDSHQQMLETLRGTDPEQVIYETSGWRVKDILAHVATWDAEVLRSFLAFRRGGAYSIPNFEGTDDFNAFAASSRMDEPIEQIRADWEATYSWLKLIFSAMSDDDFSAEMTHPSGKRGTARGLAQEIAEHTAEHAEHIRSGLKSP